jgi:hypothetical protein
VSRHGAGHHVAAAPFSHVSCRAEVEISAAVTGSRKSLLFIADKAYLALSELAFIRFKEDR